MTLKIAATRCILIFKKRARNINILTIPYFFQFRDSLIPNDHGGGVGGENMDQERRIRREIANSNERRRMQSINAGFQSLRTLLPHHEGEKLSKVRQRPEICQNNISG